MGCFVNKILPVMLKDDTTIKRTEKMNRQANASAKSKEVQRHPQADTRLHHICFFPTLKRHDTMPLRPIVLKGEQKRVLFLQVTDPIQIKGVAGSGKTTVALYRAKHLLDTQSNLFQEATG